MAKIFSNIGTSVVVNNIPADAYDTEFNQTDIITLYNNSMYSSISPIKSDQGLLANYYKTYGYTSLIGDAAAYLTGNKSATNLLQGGLSTLIPGVTNSSIGSFILHTTNMALRSPFISNLINTTFPSPFNLRPEGVIKWQYLPSQYFLTSNPPTEYITTSDPASSVFGIISNAAASVFSSTIVGLANSGRITSYDWDRAFGKGLATAEIIMMAQSGLKYTEAVGWFDPTRPKWSDRPGYITYDRYIAYADGELNYPKASSKYSDTMLDRFNQSKPVPSLASLTKEPAKALNNAPIPTGIIPKNISPITKGILSSGVDNAKSYKAVLGKQVDPNKDPDKKYSNTPEIREAINRLGFPLYGVRDSKLPGDWNDAINIQDLITDNSYVYEKSEQRDIIDFRFEDISSVGKDNPVVILFRAAITGLTDDWTPEWTDTKYLGRPDPFYTYNGYTRKIGFDMKVYCHSKNEVVPQWRKLNRLAGMCYPVSYAGTRVMKAPIIRLTIGNLYRRIYGFLDSFGLTIPDDAMWDTDIGYQLPMILTAKIGFTVIYETDGQGAPISDMPHFNQDALFPRADGTGEQIYGNRFQDKLNKTNHPIADKDVLNSRHTEIIQG